MDTLQVSEGEDGLGNCISCTCTSNIEPMIYITLAFILQTVPGSRNELLAVENCPVHDYRGFGVRVLK